MNTINETKIFELKRVVSLNGTLTPITGEVDIPFAVRRVYYLYDVPGGAARGGHAHIDLEQIIIAANGSFDVILDDGTERKTYTLNRPYSGLYIPRMLWREINNFSSGGIALVMASTIYSEDDYIRDYDSFCQIKEKLSSQITTEKERNA